MDCLNREQACSLPAFKHCASWWQVQESISAVLLIITFLPASSWQSVVLIWHECSITQKIETRQDQGRETRRHSERGSKRSRQSAVPKLKLRNSRKSRCALFFMLFGHMADKAVIWIAASLKKKKKGKKTIFVASFFFFFFSNFLKKTPSSKRLLHRC